MNRYLPGSKNPDRAEPIPESDGQAQSASVPNGGTLREEAYWPNTMEVEEPSGLSCHSYISPSHHKRNPADFPQVRSCSVPSVEGEHFQVGADLPIDVAGDDSVHLENESIRTRSHLESRSITARDLAIGFQELDRQNVLDRVKLESTSLTKGQREEIATALQNRSQVLTSLSVYAQPSSVANWYTPFTRASNSRDGVQSDALWGIQLIHRRILLLLVNGNVLDFDIPVLLFKGVLLVVWYFVLYFVLQRTIASPGGAVFDTLVCVALSSIIGGTLSTLVALPALIGILVSAIVWNSLPGSLAGAIPSIVKKISKNVGATIIVLKAGLSIDLEGMRSTLLPSFCLATLSVLGEALFHYIFAYFVYHMDHITAWLYGIALSGTSPAIVVPAGFYLQALGRGVKSGILPMLFTSVASNVTFCLLVFNILFDIKYPVGGSSNLGLLLGLIPVQVIGGPVIGIALGYAVIFMLRIIVARRGAHDRSYYSASVYLTTSMLGLSLLLTFAGGFLSVPGGATLAVFCLALSVKYFVPSDVEYQEEFEKASHSVSVLWDVLVQPFLFGLIGASTTLMHLFAWSNLKYYLASGLIGVAARTLFVIPILRLTSRLELKEMIYVSFALCARATPQAALGGNLSDRVYAYPDQYSEEVEEFGEIIHVQSLLAIFLLGPLSAILMKVFGSRLTRSDAEVESSTQWSSTSQNGVENTNENESEKSVTENRMAAPTSPRMLTQFSSPSTILRMPGPSPRRSNMPASPGRSTGQHVAFRLHSDAMPIGMDQERDLLNCRRRPVTSAQTGGLSHGPSENCARDATSASVCSSLQVMDATKFEQGPQTRFDNEPNTRIFHTEGDPELDSTSEDDSVYSNPA